MPRGLLAYLFQGMWIVCERVGNLTSGKSWIRHWLPCWIVENFLFLIKANQIIFLDGNLTIKLLDKFEFAFSEYFSLAVPSGTPKVVKLTSSKLCTKRPRCCFLWAFPQAGVNLRKNLKKLHGSQYPVAQHSLFKFFLNLLGQWF